MVSSEEIKQWIEAGLANSRVSIIGDGHHFEATVICKDFAGKNRLQRHRMVYEALGNRMGNEIHALSFKTLTENEI